MSLMMHTHLNTLAVIFPGGGPFKSTAFTAVAVAVFIILAVVLAVRSRRNK
jgi:uridylate kinase